MTREEFTSELSWFCKYYNNFEMNETMINIWFDLFGHYVQQKFNEALRKHIKYDETPYFPSAGKITKQLSAIVRTIQ